MKSTRGNSYILVIIDNLSKYVKLYPTPNTSAQYILKSLRSFVLAYGLPTRIVSDRGTGFTSKAFEEYCRSNGIVHSVISVRHPQSNGQVERVNATLIPVIQATTKTERNWDRCMEEAECHLNNSENATTRQTPFETLMGFRPVFFDGALNVLTNTNDATARKPVILQEAARKKIEMEHEKWRKRYNEHRSNVKYKVGDVVFIRSPPTSTGESTKLQPKFKGPLVVMQSHGDVYRVAALQDKSGRTYATTVHVSLLKGFGGAGRDEENPESDQDSESDGISDNPEDVPPSDADEGEHGEPFTPVEQGAEVGSETQSRPVRSRKRPVKLADYHLDA